MYARLDHEEDEVAAPEAELSRDGVAFFSFLNSRRGLSAPQLEWLSLEQRDLIIRNFASAAAHANAIVGAEQNVAGGCNGVLHGARSVTEMLRYMGVDKHALEPSTQPQP